MTYEFTLCAGERHQVIVNGANEAVRISRLRKRPILDVLAASITESIRMAANNTGLADSMARGLLEVHRELINRQLMSVN